MMNDYLNHLAGSWDLTGRMGSTELHQEVEAHWVLQGLFLQMHFLQQDAPAPGRTLYEAIYMFGYDEKTDVYVMHLFDTFGVSYANTPGMGQRQGDSVEFIFDYPEVPSRTPSPGLRPAGSGRCCCVQRTLRADGGFSPPKH